MRKLSELLNEKAEVWKEYETISNEMEDGEEKDMILTHLGLVLDCIECNLMYGDFINDTGKEYNYYED